jgi:hypothetical protein
MTSQSTSAVTFSRDRVFHAGALAANCSSMVAHASLSWIRSVRKLTAAIYPEVHRTGQQHLTEFGKPLQQGDSVVHLWTTPGRG